MELTKRQLVALHGIVTNIRNKTSSECKLGGFAGSGKTTLIKYLVQFFPSFAVCAYTGKAANILRRKSIGDASTIHSRIYKAYFEGGQVWFDLTDDPGCNGFIVDEASMVSSDIYDDLKSFGMPMIFVGDHGQLEPVGSEFNLMADPDYKLEEIHRNAGEIAQFAEHLRKGLPSRTFKSQEKVNLILKRNLTTEMMAQADQVICAYNATRVATNNKIREFLGYEGIVNVGEKVMCLRNNKQLGIFNGMQGIVAALYKKKERHYMDFESDGHMICGIWYDPSIFGQEKPKLFGGGKDGPNPFDYAPCITAHKAQGDEWNKVLVIEQRCKKWEHRRWSYTSASRAREALDWVIE